MSVDTSHASRAQTPELRLRLPPLLAGTSSLGSLLPGAGDARASDYLDGLWAAGVRGFDTAASYQLGGSERAIGAWLRRRGRRDDVFLLSKGGHPHAFLVPFRVHRAALLADLEGALERLGTDHLDAFLLHKDHPKTDLDAVVELMAELIERGAVRCWGVSNWAPGRIEALVERASARGAPGPALSSPHHGLLAWNRAPYAGSTTLAGSEGAEGRAFHRRTQLPVVAWAPLSGGAFFRALGRAWDSPENRRRLEAARAIAERRGVQPAQIALAYLRHEPFPVHPIVATRSPERMKAHLDAMAIELGPDELTELRGDESKEIT